MAENNKKINDLNYQQKILDAILTTQQAYWDLVFAHENYKVKRESLELAQKLFQETQIRVQEGDAAPIEALAAKAEIAKRTEELIASENLIEKSENLLKTLIDDSSELDSLYYRIQPTDYPELKEIQLDVDLLVETALNNRPDLNSADAMVNTKTIDEQHFKNALLPTLNLNVSAGLNGIGGNKLLYEGMFLDRILIDRLPGGYGNTIEQLFSGNYYDWSIGIEFRLPIFNQQEKANYHKAQLEKEKQIASKARLKQRIIIEIKNLTKDIQLIYKRIDAAKMTVELMQEKLHAEEEKLMEGLTTNYYILDFQEDLAMAKVNYLASLVAYYKSGAQLQHAVGLNVQE